ncbi:MAG TPA: carboxypeptidase regulatory-like domain-containing protein [Planctomycetes bacterium]|nr:carboxypeptidase regulatory-like domain-containing protein [Planctomycetota bacterium]
MSLFLPVLFSALACTQGPVLRGTVKSPDGSLCEGAEVSLLSSGAIPLSGGKVVRTKTDARGRFKLEGEAGANLSVWAHGEGAGGEPFCTGFRMRVKPGQILHLRGQRRERFERIQLRGLEAWGKPEELVLVWELEGSGAYTREVAIDEEGMGEIPPSFPLFMGMQMFWLRDKGGRVLFGGSVLWRKGKDGVLHPIRGARPGTSPHRLVFECPAPKPLSISVLAQESKKPIEGANLFFHFPRSGRLQKAGITDAQGKAHFRVPVFKGRSSLAVFVEKKGFSGASALLTREAIWVGRTRLPVGWKDLKPPLVFPLNKDRSVLGKIRGLDGELAREARVFFRYTLMFGENSRNGRIRAGSSVLARADPSGAFRMESLPPNINGWRAALYLTPKGWRKLLERNGKTGNPPQGPLMQLQSRSNGLPLEVSFDLNQLHLIPFQVRGIDGSPIPFPSVRWRSQAQPSKYRSFLGDRLGRGFALARGPRGVLYFARSDLGYGFQVVASPAKQAPLFLPRVDLNLQAFGHALSGRVLDEDGKPLGDVEIRPASRMLDEKDLRLLASQAINGEMVQVTTDAKGHFRLPYIPDAHEDRISLVWTYHRIRLHKSFPKGAEDLEIHFPGKGR